MGVGCRLVTACAFGAPRSLCIFKSNLKYEGICLGGPRWDAVMGTLVVPPRRSAGQSCRTERRPGCGKAALAAFLGSERKEGIRMPVGTDPVALPYAAQRRGVSDAAHRICRRSTPRARDLPLPPPC